MRKAKTLLGLSVITRTDGKNLGTVRDLIFSDNSQKLLALLMSGPELFHLIDATCVPWNQIREIGTDALMVEGDDSLIKVHSDAVIAEAFDAKQSVDGKQVTTDQGENLGHVSDLYLDDSGYVSAFEVSGGLFADAVGGKRYLENPARIKVGEDVIIVPHDSVHQLEMQADAEPGGIKGLLASASDKVGDAYDSAKASVSDAYANISSASVEKQREFVIGKVAGRDVVIPASQATMATPPALAVQAVESGTTHLSSSTTSGALEVERGAEETIVRPANFGTVQTGSGQLAPGVPVPASTLGHLNARVVEGAPESTSDAATLTELQRATPATATDISSRGDVVDGEVLVREGETITAAHADRAINAGILGTLVGSVKLGAPAAAQTAFHNVGQSAENAAIGKPAGREVDAPDGSILVAPGQIITQAILDRADLHGKRAEVIASAGLGAASVATQDTLGQVKETASNVFGTLKEKVAGLTGTAQDKKAEYDAANVEKKIKDAVGRPVTRVILAKDDSVILNTGDIITNKAIEHARQADVLDILLDSVYNQTPDITPEMLRLEGKGEDALATQAQPTGGPITATTAPNPS